jgi:hypothetical protein
MGNKERRVGERGGMKDREKENLMMRNERRWRRGREKRSKRRLWRGRKT